MSYNQTSQENKFPIMTELLKLIDDQAYKIEIRTLILWQDAKYFGFNDVKYHDQVR